MKRGIAFCIALLLFSVPAIAQDDPTIYFLVNGGLSLPQKPQIFKTAWKQGFNVGGGMGYRFARQFSVQALVNYDRFPFSEAGFMDLFTEEVGIDPRDLGLSLDVQGANVTVLSVSGELKASVFGDPDKVSPYVIGGFGIAHLSTSDTTLSLTSLDLVLNYYDYLEPSFYYNPALYGIDFTETIEGESETKMMALFGGGVDIPIGERVGLFVEVRYQFNFTEDDRTDFASFHGGVKIGL